MVCKILFFLEIYFVKIKSKMKKTMKTYFWNQLFFILLNLILSIAWTEKTFAAIDFPFSNIQQIKSQLGFLQKYPLSPVRQLKIAILDKGFLGYESEIGKTLPSNTEYIPGPIAPPQDLKVEHGLKMAQILNALLTNNMEAQQWTPQLYLYNVYGFTNFKAAIDDLISKKVDLVLYSEVWEYGGNNDGWGFINVEVNKAIQNNVVWINAAGNYQLTTYNSKVVTGNENWVTLPDQNQALKIQCKTQQADLKCSLKIVLSWNDFKNDVNIGTEKDLDLALTDDMLNIIQTSALKQSSDPDENRPGYSKYPREIITAEINSGTYFIRVKNRSLNFTSNDSLRITVDGDNVVMPSHSLNESILNPADNPNVITVGASDSDKSSRSEILNKPDITAPSSLILNNGDEMRGSSNSAAIVAAGVGIVKGLNPQINKYQILKLLTATPVENPWNQSGLSLQALGFSFTGPGCFIEAQLPNLPTYITDVLKNGGVMVATTAGYRIMTPYDPIILNPSLYRYQWNDLIVATPIGFQIYPRWTNTPQGSIEVFQKPIEAGLCTIPQNGLGSKKFHL